MFPVVLGTQGINTAAPHKFVNVTVFDAPLNSPYGLNHTIF